MKRLQHFEGRRRVAIENVQPVIDGGQFPIKRVIGQNVVVEADVFSDGQGALVCLLRYRHETQTGWRELAMTPLGADRWGTSFAITELGRYYYTLTAWIDGFFSWRQEFTRRRDAEDIGLALQAGAQWVAAAATRAAGNDKLQLAEFAELLRTVKPEAGNPAALSETLARLMRAYPDRTLATDYPEALCVWAEPVKARYSTWYEFFPRSCVSDVMQHGSFAECEKRLPYVAAMGFDVVYLPPIHPIGLSKRKGANNSLQAGAADVGSPWAIGGADGGHKAIHAQLGTLADFQSLLMKAQELGMDIALDIAFQCALDHPYVREHPEWFRQRADGSIQYAENPPKKYEDIYPFNFETEAWRELWQELLDVVLYWIEQGVSIFRVDNPHTKPFTFWEWLLAEVKREHPEIIFLAEAFTRPKVIYRLSKLGFTQSYNYFPWRNTKSELETYFTELTSTEAREYFRPNLWPNTPDILAEYLQFGGRPAFMLRLALAATLGASYGIYGPAYELMEATPREAGGEEYLDSEKYQVRRWDIDRADSLKDFIARINQIRRENSALQQDQRLHFLPVDNESLLCFAKIAEDGSNIMLIVANLDPHHSQSGWVNLNLELLGLDDKPFQMHDLLTGARFLWSGARNYVELNPLVSPVHIFKLRRRVRTEHDFDYFL